MEHVVYLLCAATALACAVLLLRAFRRTGVQLLLWCGVFFVAQTCENVLLFIDRTTGPDLDLSLWRTVPALTGAVLLIAGLFARLATLPLLGIIAVIQIFVYPDAWAEHLTWTTLLLLVLLRGPGPLSLDHALARMLVRFGVRAARA